MSDVQKVKQLRDMTGAGVLEARNALRDAGDDVDAAVKILHERGLVKAEKKGGRTTGASLLESYIHNNRIGVLLQIGAETDFAVHSEPVRELAHDIAMQIASMNPQDNDELLKQVFVKDGTIVIEDHIKRTIAKVGENISVIRFARYEI